MIDRLRKIYIRLRHDGRALMSQRRSSFWNIQAVRGLIVLGPLNGIFVAYHRRFRPTQYLSTSDSSLLSDLEPPEAVAAVRIRAMQRGERFHDTMSMRFAMNAQPNAASQDMHPT